jgi:FkbH-like protein
MWTFIKLKKAAEASLACEKKYRVAVLGDTATQLLSQCLRGELFLSGQNADVFDADYNQIIPLVIDKDSELYQFEPDYVILYQSMESLYASFQKTGLDERKSFASYQVSQLKMIVDEIHSHLKDAKIIVFNYIPRNDLVYGSYGLKVTSSFVYQVRKLDYLLMEASDEMKIYLFDLESIALEHGYKNLHDDSIFDVSTLAINTAFLPYVTSGLKDMILAMRGVVRKCIVLDLDNTLWGGVIGDDGMEGIQIGELKTGKAFLRFQKWLKELSYRGIILAVCSKNDEEIAMEPFLKHSEMVLRMEDIAVFMANWQDKASNIRIIQKRLNVGMDSIVFIDDNPFERELVKKEIPEICVPEMPQNPSDYVSYLESLNLFETSSHSLEDRIRGKQYKEEASRRKAEETYGSIDDFLKGLHMVSEYSSFQQFYYARIAQLTQRSNQFNLRTVRYTTEDIERISKDEDYLTLQFSLKDDFGDSGLISLLILKKEEETLFIDTWIMSCRVLKRTMEEFVINELVRYAKEKGFRYLKGQYIETKKNRMVKEIYLKEGFRSLGNGDFLLDTSDFEERKTFIKGERV